ncbi:hypothetical protein DEJ45_02575 [Streptomyces venezuelae]|nr:hypothetical protein DEJ45_02575 [Streptomyces venezuelae]
MDDVDVEQISDELYGLRPAEFVPARDARVAAARRAKDAKAAKAIAALRKPSLAAWAANLLARQRQREAEQFLALGRTLREAHRTLDAEQLRAASGRRRQLVTALARTAATLADEAGQPVSDTVLHEVEQTLHAVLADEEVAGQWSRGRLVKVPEAVVGFAAVTPETVPARPARTAPPPSRGGDAEARRPRDLDRVRAAAADADAEVERCERALAEAEDARRAASTRAEEAAERVRGLEHELREARQAERDTGAAATTAGSAVTSAERALRTAHRAAERAAEALRHLEGGANA